MKVTVCIGSSCHIKGSRQVVAKLTGLIEENGLSDKVELGGTFCLGHCQQGVSVTVDDVFHSVSPETVDDFFKNEILAKV
jgi:NADH:ubiquinone oxidoreductase subunit E